VRRLASEFDLSESLRDQTGQLFRTAQIEDLLRGRSIEAIAAASVYEACQCHGRSQLLNDIVAVATVGESLIADAYKTLNEELGRPAKPATPTMYVPRLASDLDCPEQIRRRARALAEAAEDAGVTTGVHPAGFAAACLYTAGQEAGRWVTQAKAAAVASVTATTIRNHRDVLQELDIGQCGDRATAVARERAPQNSR